MGILERLGTLLLCLLGISFVALPARAEIPDASIPPELRPWVPWVLDSLPERDCRTIESNRICVWPGALRVDVGTGGGRFELSVWLDMEDEVPLPGAVGQWPEDVRVDGRPAAVLAMDDKPVVRVTKGPHLVAGTFVWSKLPESLAVPGEVATVKLSVNGKDVLQEKRDRGDALWLASESEETTEAEALDLDVSRRLDDGVPLDVTTHVTLRVSGKAREVDLGRVLAPDTTAVKLDSELPARFTPDGTLHVKLRSGTYSLEIAARSERSLDALKRPELPAPWPEEEVWVWNAKAALRDVDVTGAPSVDPARTRLIEAWRALPAYLVGRGGSLRLTTTRRGEAEPPPNRLELARTLWLDLDGSGFSVRDEFTGVMERGFRLDRSSGELGRASVSGTDQLITVGKSGRRGVELRQKKLALVAESREEGARDLAAVGWSEGVERLRAELVLPPGYSLFATSGVDSAPDTWVSSWDLFDVLFIVLVVAAFSRLSGVRWGAVLLVLLVLSHGEEGAPFVTWIALIAVSALLRVAAGRLERVLRVVWVAAAVAFAFIAVSYVVEAVQQAAYPAKPHEESTLSLSRGKKETAYRAESDAKTAVEQAPLAAPATVAPEESRVDEAKAVGGSADLPAPTGTSLGLRRAAESGRGWSKVDLGAQDPNAVIQTGPGLPNWTSRSFSLGWSGPVDHEQRVRLYLVTPTIARLLTAARVLLLALLGLLVFRKAPRGSAPKGAATLAALVVAMLGASTPARADTPSRELLDELKQRLVPAAPCGDKCLSVSLTSVRVEGRRVSIESDAHAGAPTTLRLPGPAATWVFDGVTVDGQPSAALVLASDGFLHLRVDAGIHRVRLEGRIGSDELDLALGDVPRRVTVSAPGWEVQGVREDGRTDGSLHFSRRAPQGGEPDQKAESATLAPWFEVERRVELGVLWTVRSTLRRVSPPGVPAVLRYPLLAGETVTSAEHVVEKGEVVISLGRDDTTATWESSLSPRTELRLVAPNKVPWTEVWVLDCSVIWHCATAGLPPVSRIDSGGRQEPTFRPWPGESVGVKLERPAAARGASITIDRVKYTLKPGTRLLDASLGMELRNSAGGSQKFELPAGATLDRVRVNGEERAARLEGRILSVTLRPGSQNIEITFKRPGALSTRFQAPAVGIGREFVNANVDIELPEERWLLFAGGPAWGSVILFWGYVGVILVIALALPRVPGNTLKSSNWLLLGLGLTQAPALAAAFVAGWFFLVQYRKTSALKSPLAHNGLQLLVVGSTLIVLVIVIATAYRGLVLSPDMMVTGGSERHLGWYVDRAGPATPAAWVVSVPLLVFRVLMIAWSLWASWSFIGWLKKAYAAFSTGPWFVPLWSAPPTAQKGAQSESADQSNLDSTPRVESDRNT